MFTVFFRGRPKIRSPASTKRDRSTNTTNHSRKCNCVFPTSGTTTTINTRISLHSQLVTLSHTTAASRAIVIGPVGCQFLSQSPVASQSVASLSEALRSPQKPSDHQQPANPPSKPSEALRSPQNTLTTSHLL